MELWKIDFLQEGFTNELSTSRQDPATLQFEAKNSADAINKSKKWAKTYGYTYNIHFKVKRIDKDRNADANEEVRQIKESDLKMLIQHYSKQFSKHLKEINK